VGEAAANRGFLTLDRLATVSHEATHKAEPSIGCEGSCRLAIETHDLIGAVAADRGDLCDATLLRTGQGRIESFDEVEVAIAADQLDMMGGALQV
jgi:hypothetical protein